MVGLLTSCKRWPHLLDLEDALHFAVTGIKCLNDRVTSAKVNSFVVVSCDLCLLSVSHWLTFCIVLFKLSVS